MFTGETPVPQRLRWSLDVPERFGSAGPTPTATECPGAERLVGWLKEMAERKLVIVATGDPRIIAVSGELIGSGEKPNLETLLDRVREGPILSRVDRVKVDWIEEENDKPFHIRP